MATPVMQHSLSTSSKLSTASQRENLAAQQKLMEETFKEFSELLEGEAEGNLCQASIIALGNSIQKSNAKTINGILGELNNICEYFTKQSSLKQNSRLFKSRLTFKAIAEIFVKVIKRVLQSNTKSHDIAKIKGNIKKETEALIKHCIQCSDRIERHSMNVLRDGMTILVHSYSRNVMKVLECAAKRGIRINVVATESQPICSGDQVVKECKEIGIPVQKVYDSSIGLCIGNIDCVFVGAEAVLENGGIVNRIGTFTIALCAKQYNKPFYVFTESLKFLKRFPLQQSDVFSILEDDAEMEEMEGKIVDYTPPEFISELFTDIGIFTPAAVSDELIKYF